MAPLEPRVSPLTVMTSRDAQAIFGVMQAAARDHRCGMPPGIHSLEELKAAMRTGLAFFLAYNSQVGTDSLSPVGVIGYRWERGTLRVVHVAVTEPHRGSGIARRLLEAVERVGLALGTTNVTLTVQGTGSSRALFERAGYNLAQEATSVEIVRLSKALGRSA